MRLERQVIRGRDGSIYLVRYQVGRLSLHVFHRGDRDRHTHDHPHAFWTFPLKGYYELVEEPTGFKWHNYVESFKLHYRPATYRHRVVFGHWPVVTIVWSGKPEREWGFWVDGEFVLWRDYLKVGKQ